MPLIPALGGRGRRISVSSRLAWSTRASSRTGSKATHTKKKRERDRRKKETAIFLESLLKGCSLIC